jgi:hypothetical protein
MQVVEDQLDVCFLPERQAASLTLKHEVVRAVKGQFE